MLTHRTLLLLTALCVLVSVACLPGRAAQYPPTLQALPAKAPLPLRHPVQDKNFYLLSLLEREPRAEAAIRGSAELSGIHTAKSHALSDAFDRSANADAHSITTLSFSDAEIAAAGAALSALYGTSPEMRAVVDGPLRASGNYERYASETGAELVAHAWRDCARGINNIIRVYGLGESGRSPAIDSISYDPKSFLYGALLHNVLGVLKEDESEQMLFFQPSLAFALQLLDVNQRDEAGRFEPMEKGQNRIVCRHIRSIDWRRYPYSVIVVPGEGPEEPNVRFSPIGKLDIGLAARRYKQGKAPLILVSGGFVHPKQTPYCEAIEMKRSLMKDFGIPQNAIIIDPHARHTTTNLRNAVRLIYRYGIPFGKPGLITTNTYQSGEIEDKDFHERCRRMFGYQPVTLLKRLSPFDLEFLPRRDSLYIDSLDPLDP